MNDEPLDPEEERVRALLADLGGAPDASRMPEEVAARLDETLAGLVAARSRPDVVPLRRRWVRRAAVAAAAVIVVGVGGIIAADLGVFGGASNETDSSAGGAAAGDSRTPESPAGSATASPSKPQALSGTAARLPRVSASSFGADVARLLHGSPAGDSTQPRESERKAAGQAAGPRATACAGPSTGDGSTTALVLYDGTPAALVIHPDRGGERLVEAWTCGGGRRLDSTRVPGSASPGDQDGTAGLGSPSPTP